MAQSMFLIKSNKFEPLAIIPGLSNSPGDYPDVGVNSYRKKMRIVADSSENDPKLGAWYAAKCLVGSAGGGTGQVGNIYAVYFPLNEDDQPIVSANIRAGAPCPPFCQDEGAGRQKKQPK